MIKSATKILSSSLGNSNNKRWWLGGNLLPILHDNLILLSTDGSLEKDSTGCLIIFLFLFPLVDCSCQYCTYGSFFDSELFHSIDIISWNFNYTLGMLYYLHIE